MHQTTLGAAVRAQDSGAARPSVIERAQAIANKAGSPAPSVPAVARGGIENALADFVRAHAAESVNEERVRQIVADALAMIEPRQVRVSVGDREPVTIDGPVHPAFEEVLRRLAVGLPVLLVGPAGTGKTYLARQVARALGIEWRGIVSFTAGTSEGALLGRILPTGAGGSFEYHATPYVQAFEQGGVVCLDEIDQADPNTIGCLNASLANGETSLPARVGNPIAIQHEGFAVVACANTFCNGGSREYVGRNQLDAAFVDRFTMGRVLVDYDRAFEERLTGAQAHPVKMQLVERWAEIREKASQYGLRVVASTRTLLNACRLVDAHGYTPEQCVRILAMGWSADVRTRLGVGS